MTVIMPIRLIAFEFDSIGCLYLHFIEISNRSLSMGSLR